MLQVRLAGYNVDSSLLSSLDNPAATPETISAAYARISRSPKTVTELRSDALREINKARRSNQNIIFEMGHASIAEHAVFNFDIIGISRLLAETVESIRLASFTEKSQRYVTFTRAWVLPAELDSRPELRDRYEALMDALFTEYQRSFEALVKHHRAKHPELSGTELECKAKEDARYILPLATQTQLGLTINARSLENLLRRLDAHPLQEARELYHALLEDVRKICPSLIRHASKDDFHGNFKLPHVSLLEDGFDIEETVRMITVPSDPDNRILAALLYERSQGDYAACLEYVRSLDAEAKAELYRRIFAGIKPWSKLPRAFELAEFTFELKMSESCWAQFKRHRIGTFVKQAFPYDETYLLPGPIISIRRRKHWSRLQDMSFDLITQLANINLALAAYVRTNADKVKVLARMNLRELYHFTRLRSDEHAQWEIRKLSKLMTRHIQKVAPLSASYLCGKSELVESKRD